MIRFELQIDGATEIDRAFNRIDRFISDFRNVWPAVTDEFYAIEESQFASQGSKGASGRWAPLSKAYAAYKAQAFPGQPILRAENSRFFYQEVQAWLKRWLNESTAGADKPRAGQ